MEYLKNSFLNCVFCWALGFCATAHAQWENNWLLGLSVALAERENNLDFTINHSDIAFTGLISTQDDNGLVGGILGGYQMRCRDWLYGIELNVAWQELAQENATAFTDAFGQGVNLSAHYRQRNIIGLSGRVGYEMFPRFLPYIRVGVLSSRDKLVVTGSSTNLASSFDMEGMRRVYRWTGGIGFETPICLLMGLSFRAEYNFQSRAGSIEATGVALDNISIAVAGMRPKTHQFLVAIVLNFI